MKVTLKEVDRIASLSMISLNEETRLMLQQSLDEILEHAEKLKQFDTEGVEPTTYILKQENILRDDVVSTHWTRDEMLENAPQRDEGCFVIPKVVD